MEKLEQIIETYRLTIQKAELELRNARKRIYYISLCDSFYLWEP